MTRAQARAASGGSWGGEGGAVWDSGGATLPEGEPGEDVAMGERGVEQREGSGDGPTGQVAEDHGAATTATDEWTVGEDAEGAMARSDEEMAEVADEADEEAEEDMVVDEEAEWGTAAAESTLASMFDGGIVEAVADFCGGLFDGMDVE